MQLIGKEHPPDGVLRELESLSASAASALSEALEALESKDIPRANQVIDDAKRVAKEREKILRELSTKRGKLAVGLAYVLESLERSTSYASDLAEIAINHAVEATATVENPAERSRLAAPAAQPA